MSPLERVFDLQSVTKIRVQCGKCATLVAFDLVKTPYYVLTEKCPFCSQPWELVERTVIGLREAFAAAKDLKGNRIELQLKGDEV